MAIETMPMQVFLILLSYFNKNFSPTIIHCQAQGDLLFLKTFDTLDY